MGYLWFTDDPVRDMERYEQRAQEETDRRGVFGYCEQCGKAIYNATDCEYGDSYLEVNGVLIHEECMGSWISDHKKEAV